MRRRLYDLTWLESPPHLLCTITSSLQMVTPSNMMGNPLGEGHSMSTGQPHDNEDPTAVILADLLEQVDRLLDLPLKGKSMERPLGTSSGHCPPQRENSMIFRHKAVSADHCTILPNNDIKQLGTYTLKLVRKLNPHIIALANLLDYDIPYTSGCIKGRQTTNGTDSLQDSDTSMASSITGRSPEDSSLRVTGENGERFHPQGNSLDLMSWIHCSSNRSSTR